MLHALNSLPSREECLARYQSLLQARSPSALSDKRMASLSPYACYAINRTYREPSTEVNWLTGTRTPAIVHLSESVSSPVCLSELWVGCLRMIGLQSARVCIPDLPVRDYMSRCICEAHSLFPDIMKHVLDFTGAIAFLSGTNAFASASFFQTPYCTFVTGFALQAIPPLTGFGCYSVYPFIEALYHESIHHRIHEAIRMVPLTITEAVSVKVVGLPAPRTDWSLEHCVHGLTVYSCLLELRSLACDMLETSHERTTVASAFQEGLVVANMIARAVERHKEDLSDPWRAFVTVVLDGIYAVQRNSSL